MAVLAIIGIVGVAVGAYASIEAGQAAEAAGRANQKILKQQAEFARQAADVAQAQSREWTRRIQGTAAATIGISGVTPEGSPLLTMIDNAQQGELQARLIDASGKREAYAALAGGRLARFQGYQAATASYLRAGSTLLTGAGFYGSGFGFGTTGGGGATYSTSAGYQSYRAGERASY